MKATERIERINSDLNKHFKRNKSNWWVSHSSHDIHTQNNGACVIPQKNNCAFIEKSKNMLYNI